MPSATVLPASSLPSQVKSVAWPFQLQVLTGLPSGPERTPVQSSPGTDFCEKRTTRLLLPSVGEKRSGAALTLIEGATVSTMKPGRGRVGGVAVEVGDRQPRGVAAVGGLGLGVGACRPRRRSRARPCVLPGPDGRPARPAEPGPSATSRAMSRLVGAHLVVGLHLRRQGQPVLGAAGQGAEGLEVGDEADRLLRRVDGDGDGRRGEGIAGAVEGLERVGIDAVRHGLARVVGAVPLHFGIGQGREGEGPHGLAVGASDLARPTWRP